MGYEKIQEEFDELAAELQEHLDGILQIGHKLYMLGIKKGTIGAYIKLKGESKDADQKDS